MNKNFMLLVLALLTAILTSGCAHKSLSPSSLKTIDRPAIVLRMLGEPELSLSEQDADQVPRLRARINAFQMSERLRSALIHHLPNVEPWTDIMPSVEVATALDTLLVQDKAEAPRYELLTQKGSNTVLEIVVFRAGLHFNPKTKKTGFFLDGKARLFALFRSRRGRAQDGRFCQNARRLPGSRQHRPQGPVLLGSRRRAGAAAGEQRSGAPGL